MANTLRLVVCFSLFALSFAFPSESAGGGKEVEKYRVQLVSEDTGGVKGALQVQPGGSPYTRRFPCSLHPFFGQTCLPPALQFFMPLQTLLAERLRYLSVPLLNAYVVKLCPPTDSVWKEGNSNKSWKEIIKEVKTETEKERLPDNTNAEVNGKEVESEYFVKKESSLETEESERTEIKSTINRVSEETEISSENESPERPPREKDIYDENISITSNLV